MSAPTNFQVTGSNSLGIIQFSLFSMEKPNLQNLTCRKIGQGQPRVIIYINFVELESPMLHAKFQGHRTILEKKILKGFLPYMGMAAILVM